MLSHLGSANQVYLNELQGNTLVVRPRGDTIGFGLHQVRMEMGVVRQLAEDRRVKHLLIDLSLERYYGSMVLGDLIEFGNLVRARGGRVGLCAASPEFLTVLQHLQLGEIWEYFPTRDAGLQAIATIPWSQQFWARRHVAIAALTALVLLVAIACWPQGDRGADYAKQVLALWEDDQRADPQLSEEERQYRARRLQDKLDPLIAELLRRGKARSLTELEQATLFAARPWLKSVHLRGSQAEFHRNQAELYVDITRSLLDPNYLPVAALSPIEIAVSVEEPPLGSEAESLPERIEAAEVP